MLLVLIAWVIISAIFLIFGDMLIRFWNIWTEQNQTYTTIDTFWIGLCIVSSITCILTLFIPINIFVLIAFIAIAILYSIIYRRDIVQKFIELKTSWIVLPKWTKCSIGIIAIVILIYATQAINLFDFGLYHEQSMIWTEQYRIIPGLGNIHGRLAFNSNFLLLSTLFSYHPPFFNSIFPLNSLCVFVFSVWTIIRVKNSGNVLQNIVFIGINLLFFLLFFKIISSTSTDILPAILVMYILFNLALNKDKIWTKALLYIALGISCITFKLSAAPILIIVFFILFLSVKDKKYKILFFALLFGLVVIIPWLTRFVLLSGYIVYPIASIDLFSFDWKIPAKMVTEEKELMEMWAKIPYPDWDRQRILSMSITEWFPIWLVGKKINYLFLYILAAFSPATLLLSAKNIVKDSKCIIAYICALTGFLFGFLSAPDLRFTAGFVICSGFIPLYLIAGKINFTKNAERKLSLTTPILICTIFLMLGGFGVKILMSQQNDTGQGFSFIYKPLQIARFMSTDYIGNEMKETFAKKEGINFEINMPLLTQRCFDYALPCTPIYQNNIEMRGNTFQDGFRIKQ